MDLKSKELIKKNTFNRGINVSSSAPFSTDTVYECSYACSQETDCYNWKWFKENFVANTAKNENPK